MGKVEKIMLGILGVVVGAVLLGKAIPVLLPELTGSGSDIAALTQTDTVTKLFQSFWPIVLLVIGFVVIVGVIVWAIRAFRNKGGAM